MRRSCLTPACCSLKCSSRLINKSKAHCFIQGNCEMFSHKHTGFGQEMCPGHLIVAFAKCVTDMAEDELVAVLQTHFILPYPENTLCPPKQAWFALILCCFQLLPSSSMTSFNPHSLLMSRLNGEGINICLGFKDHAVPVLMKHLYLFFIMTSLIILGTFGACWLYLLPW